MSRTASTIILVVLTAMLVSCSSEEPLRADLLAGDWVRSYEEDSTATAVETYRPIDSRTFPPSRFRMRYIFNADGTCQWLDLMPNDAHELRAGTWWTETNDQNVVRIAQGTAVVGYRIQELGSGTLKWMPID